MIKDEPLWLALASPPTIEVDLIIHNEGNILVFNSILNYSYHPFTYSITFRNFKFKIPNSATI